MVEHRPNELIVYERFDGYWNPDAQPSAKLEIRVDPGRQRPVQRTAHRRGGRDRLLSTALYRQAAETDGLVADPRNLLSFEAVYMNRTRGELGNKLVRQAMMYAIDREGLVAGVLGGLGDPQVQPFPSNYFAFDDELPDDLYAFDPDKARALLKEAGLENAVTFELIYPAYNEPSATAVQAMLADVGIDITDPGRRARRHRRAVLRPAEG